MTRPAISSGQPLSQAFPRSRWSLTQCSWVSFVVHSFRSSGLGALARSWAT